MTTTSRPSTAPGTTVRASTVLSAFTTKTYWPFCPLCTACDGTTTAPTCRVRVSAALTNCPGQSAFSVFSKVALSWMVPVLGSTVLFTKVSRPRTTPPGAPGACTSTGKSPSSR